MEKISQDCAKIPVRMHKTEPAMMEDMVRSTVFARSVRTALIAVLDSTEMEMDTTSVKIAMTSTPLSTQELWTTAVTVSIKIATGSMMRIGRETNTNPTTAMPTTWAHSMMEEVSQT